ncbi:MAG: heavy metal-responsive transcriptional regulator [Anaerolineae bacterium]
MQIKELARRTNLSGKTIRYYESVGLLPPPRRLSNGYRDYDETAVDRVRFVAGARTLGFSLDDIGEILALRDRREAPCRVVLDMLEEKAAEIRRRIAELQQLEVQLHELHALGLTFPTDDVDGKNCVCHLVSERAANTG